MWNTDPAYVVISMVRYGFYESVFVFCTRPGFEKILIINFVNQHLWLFYLSKEVVSFVVVGWITNFQYLSFPFKWNFSTILIVFTVISPDSWFWLWVISPVSSFWVFFFYIIMSYTQSFPFFQFSVPFIINIIFLLYMLW